MLTRTPDQDPSSRGTHLMYVEQEIHMLWFPSTLHQTTAGNATPTTSQLTRVCTPRAATACVGGNSGKRGLSFDNSPS